MLRVENIKKSFHKKAVVQDVSFSVQKGEAFGLLGPNGAGKSTLIAMICGLFPYEEGDILVGGLSVKKEPLAIKQKIGIVPQEIALYPTMSAVGNLVFWGRMYGLTRAEAKKRAYEVLTFVGLRDRAKGKIETFSGGMKRRINIGCALMHKPELLIMDEPTVGIDPQSRNHILETVKKLNQQGMTVIYTSHYMEEVDYLCERIGILDKGKMIALGNKDELRSRLAGGTEMVLQLSSLSSELVSEFEMLTDVIRVNPDFENNKLKLLVHSSPQIVANLIDCTTKLDVGVLSLERNEANLESLFLQLTGRSLRG